MTLKAEFGWAAAMKIEFTLPSRRGAPPLAFTGAPVCEPEERPHRIARVMALAHKLDELVRSGEVTDHGELARLGHVSQARICQYMTLLHLARPSRSIFSSWP